MFVCFLFVFIGCSDSILVERRHTINVALNRFHF